MKALETSRPDRVKALLAAYGSATANAAYILCDRHPRSSAAFVHVRPDLTCRKIRYGLLNDQSRRFAAALATLGVSRGHRVVTLMEASPDLAVSVLGALRRGAICVPLSTQLPTEALATRLTNCRPQVVICDARQRARVAAMDNLALPRWHTVVANRPGADGDASFSEMLASHRPSDRRSAAIAVGGDGIVAEVFLSRTVGATRSVPVRLKEMAGLQVYLEVALDVRADDVYWVAAEMTGFGFCHGLLTPMAAGRPSILMPAPDDPALAWRIVRQLRVSNLVAAPALLQALVADTDQASQSGVRRVSSTADRLTLELRQ